MMSKERYLELLRAAPHATREDLERLKTFQPRKTPIAHSVSII